MNMYEARWENAKRVGLKIQNFIDNGYIIFNEWHERIKKIKITKNKVLIIDKNHSIILYENDSSYDHGALDSIDEWNAQFEHWLVINPKNIERIFEVDRKKDLRRLNGNNIKHCSR